MPAFWQVNNNSINCILIWFAEFYNMHTVNQNCTEEIKDRLILSKVSHDFGPKWHKIATLSKLKWNIQNIILLQHVGLKLIITKQPSELFKIYSSDLSESTLVETYKFWFNSRVYPKWKMYQLNCLFIFSLSKTVPCSQYLPV